MCANGFMRKGARLYGDSWGSMCAEMETHKNTEPGFQWKHQLEGILPWSGLDWTTQDQIQIQLRANIRYSTMSTDVWMIQGWKLVGGPYQVGEKTTNLPNHVGKTIARHSNIMRGMWRLWIPRKTDSKCRTFLTYSIYRINPGGAFLARPAELSAENVHFPTLTLR